MLTLAGAGTIAVYTIDRLRDLARDRTTAPRRSAFIARHRTALIALTGIALAGAALAGLGVGSAALGLAAVVATLGLLHRRLKHIHWAKPAYLTFAWTAVCVGLPAAAAGPTAELSAARLFWVAAIVAASVQANVALSNLRDREGLSQRLGHARVIAIAGGLLLLAAGAVFVGPPGLWPLLALPAAGLPAVAGFRPTERYGGFVVDGALVLGGALAWAGYSFLAPLGPGMARAASSLLP